MLKQKFCIQCKKEMIKTSNISVKFWNEKKKFCSQKCKCDWQSKYPALNQGYQKGHPSYLTPEMYKKIGLKLRGEKSPLWKGGIPKCPVCKLKTKSRQAEMCMQCYAKTLKKNPIIFRCPQCKKEFKDFRRDKNRKFCSKECSNKSHIAISIANLPKSMKKEKNPSWKGGVIEKKCFTCQSNFSVYPYRKNIARFCSYKCRVFTNETKNKMRIARLGKPSPHKGKPNLKNRGKNHWAWKGGISSENHKIRTSLEFKQWRRGVFERDDYRCIGCGTKSAKGIEVVLHADHILPFAQFPRLRFDINNGRTLCVDCHKKTETYNEKAKHFSIEGRPIIHLTQ